MFFKNRKTLIGRLLATWALISGIFSVTLPQPVFAAPGDITRISVAADGTQGNKNSGLNAISADGRYVAFDSFATNLVAGDTNGTYDVFLHNRQTGETKRVSVSSSGLQGNGISSDPSISGDGRYVIYRSYATNLVSGDTNDRSDLFLYDTQTSLTTRVSVDSAGVQGNGYIGYYDISNDGRYIVFGST